ncbi:MAG: response regulator [Eubacteriales bacterium]|nr:response regulator [Eubacteriales bacterium]
MKAAVFEWDVRSGAFYCSENYKEYAISQVPPEVILANKGSADMIRPDDTPAKLKFFADTHGGTSRAEGILRMKLTAGGYRWCRLVGLFYKDESGRPTRTLGIIIDISQEKEKSVMFETFTQEKNDVVPQYQGSGLGLAIVKQLVDLMGAQISVKSKLGEGTEFTLCFRFPVVQSAGEGQDAVVSFAPGQLKGRRVLLAEDHPLNTMIAVKLLEKVGMTVVAVQNGQEAVNQFQAAGDRRFDAILMDIRMPVMNGLEAAKAIRRIDRSDAKTIPILAMTANAFDSDVQESLQAGMNAHLAKPIEPEKMYQKLLSLIMAREGKAK